MVVAATIQYDGRLLQETRRERRVYELYKGGQAEILSEICMNQAKKRQEKRI